MHSYEVKKALCRMYTGYYINGKFSKATLNIRAELWDKVKRLRGENYFAVIKYDRVVTNELDEVARE